MRIRPATQDDWEAIISIYNQAVMAGGATADLTPVTVAQRMSWFAQHSADAFPIYVAEVDVRASIVGWCSLSSYRPGRMALRHVAEMSYYVDHQHQCQGIARRLVDHALSECPRLGLEVVVALLLEVNQVSVHLLRNRGFAKWGHLPNIAKLSDGSCGHLIYGKHLTEQAT